ncbi:hypothetical protein BofuT4_uP157280.1 [Botrytis cinerea T4]|uniref:Uncharacterized protein n=1 Tax=Botryotinia fuckeliana (strain T4) TaxID=999810 RepID=G2YUN4_BOTF4|nr:hypothetical protein BofuT4_uP157280.1 [Botrytis cinerea T4]
MCLNRFEVSSLHPFPKSTRSQTSETKPPNTNYIKPFAKQYYHRHFVSQTFFNATINLNRFTLPLSTLYDINVYRNIESSQD